jgi:hypothetical protein
MLALGERERFLTAPLPPSVSPVVVRKMSIYPNEMVPLQIDLAIGVGG